MAKADLMVISLLLLITLCFTAVDGYGRMMGGRTEITDVKTNEEVQELGRFAVEEYNRSHGLGRWRGFVSSSNGRRAELVFSQVLEAQKQVVSGIKYYLKIEAMENKLSKTFESVVVVKPWLHSKELLHFSPSAE
ncbi:hypothetical protein ES319_A03G105900v1 [Gossypium barbadense]|uniref:Cystatin domain-containing protein n=1 Tax=Gossypium barbadense TaxID=3634 RepID=A0A5J5WDN3_GOSBA|nr:hypothetical protein ES319_A03G105900v1 [Gossypium barbadense]